MNLTSVLEVFINRVPGETRLALTENGRLKNLIITCLAEGYDQDTIKSKINMNYQK